MGNSITLSFLLLIFMSIVGCTKESSFGWEKGTKPLSKLVVGPAPSLILVNNQEKLVATAYFMDGSSEDVTEKVSWRALDASIVDVDNNNGEKGWFRATTPGNTEVVASYEGLEGWVEIHVTAAQLIAIEVTPFISTFGLGAQTGFSATGIFNDGSTADLTSMCSWGSMDQAIALVSDVAGTKGYVTTVGVGSTTIAATYNGIQGVAPVNIANASLISLSLEPVAQSLPAGVAGQFQVIGLFSNNTTVDLSFMASWSSSNNSVAYVDNSVNKGFVQSLAVGDAVITASVGMLSASTNLHVTNAQLDRIQLGFSSTSWALGSTANFTATGIYTDGSSVNLTSAANWSSSNSSVFTVGNTASTSGVITAVGTGSATITANYQGESASTSISITSATLQSLSASPAVLNLANGNNQTVTITGHYSDGSTQDVSNLVTWSSSNTSVVTVSNASGSKGAVTSQGVGSAQITAAYNGFSIVTDVTISAATLVAIQMSPSSLSLASGQSQRITITGVYSDGSTVDLSSSAVWSSSNPSVLAVSNAGATRGTVTSMGVGAATLTATVNGVSVQMSAAGTAAVLASISVTPHIASLPKGESQNFAATATYSDGSTMDVTNSASWSVADVSLASISNSAGSRGRLVALDIGNTQVSASFNGQSANASVEVIAAVLQSLAFNSNDVTLPQGSSFQFVLSGTYSDGSVRDLTESAVWTSSDNSIAVVSTNAGTRGRMVGAAAGSTQISASVSGLSLSADVDVNTAALVSMQINPASVTVAKGLSQAMSVMGTYTDGSVVDLTSTAVWTSSNNSRVTVSNASGSKGVAFAANVGAATVTATVGSATANASFTVSAATLTRVEVNPTSVSLAKGLSQQVTVTGVYSDSTTMDLSALATWSSSNSAVASVSNASGSQGLVSGMGVGSAQLTVTYGSQSTQFNVSVGAANLVSISVTSLHTSFAAGTSEALTAVGTYTDGSTQTLTNSVSWTTSDAYVATVSNSAGSRGTVTGQHAGSVTVSASLNGVSGDLALDITSAYLVSIAVTPASASIAKGLSQQLVATGTYSDNSTAILTSSVVWSSSASGVVSVSNSAGTKGNSSGLAVGSATITATSGSVSGAANISVTAASLVSIDVTLPLASLAKGLGQQLVATGHYTDGSTADITTSVVWSSSDVLKASVSNTAGSKGQLSALLVGNVNISASLGGISSLGSSFDVTAAALVSIAITPADTRNLLLAWRNMTATGTFTDGSTQDLTQIATWSTNNALAFVDNVAPNKGKMRGLNLGVTSVTATIGTISGSTNFHGVLSL